MNRKELEKLLLVDSNLLKTELNRKKKEIFELIPELEDEDGFDQKNPWHSYDVWNHTLVALENSRKDIDIRLSLLLHDIGKPFSFQEDEDGTRHFKGHPQVGAKMSKTILEKLGYTHPYVDKIVFLIENHASRIDINKVNESNIENYKKLLAIKYSDASAYSPDHVKEGIDALEPEKVALLNREKELKEKTNEEK